MQSQFLTDVELESNHLAISFLGFQLATHISQYIQHEVLHHPSRPSSPRRGYYRGPG